MVNILETIHNGIPDFPTDADVDEQLFFLFQQIERLNRKLQAAAEDAPDGISGSFTSADGTPQTVTVTDGVITSIEDA